VEESKDDADRTDERVNGGYDACCFGEAVLRGFPFTLCFSVSGIEYECINESGDGVNQKEAVPKSLSVHADITATVNREVSHDLW